MQTGILVLLLISLVILLIIAWNYGYNIFDTIALICLAFLLIMIFVTLFAISEDAKNKPNNIGTATSGPTFTILIIIALVYVIFWGFFVLADKYIKPNNQTN